MSKITKILVGALLAVTLAAGSASAATTWSRSLKVGSRGADVQALQQFLNMCADTKVDGMGAGSAGHETTYFGPATKSAVVRWQMARGVTPASGLFGPLSRAKAATLQASSNVCGGGVIITPPPVGQTGPVSASLSATTPAAGYIIDTQATAGLLDVTFTGSGTVNSVTLHRSGISDQNTLSNVYVYDGAMRLTDGYSFNSQGNITINNLNLMVNGSRTISIRADVYSSASSTASTVAVALTGFTSGASVNTVNIQGNLMNIASGGSLASITFPSANSVSTGNVNAGVSGYTVWRQAVQINTRALWLKAANFRVTGSAPANALANVKLYVDGVDTGKVANMVMLNGSNYLSFDLTASPLTLNTGSHTLDLRADVVAGSSYNFTVSLQQASDLMIMDPQVGVNIAVTSFSQSTAGTITILGGSVTQSIDSDFSPMTNVTGGASNATIGKWKLHGYGEDVKVYTLSVTPLIINGVATSCTTNGSGAPTGTCGLQNVTVYFNGSQVGTQTPSWVSGSGAITYNLGSQMIIPAGADSTLEVRADLRTTGGANYTAGAVSATTSIVQANVEGMTSHTNTNFPVTLSGSAHALTVQTGLLAVSANSGYAGQSANPNTTAVKIGSYVLQNQSSSEAVRVTTLAVALAETTTTGFTNYASLYTSENSNPIQPQASNTFSVDFTLAPGAMKTVDIFANTGSATTGTIQSTLTVTSIGVSSNVSTTSSGIPGQIMTLGAGTLGVPTVTASSSTTAQYIASANGATDAAMFTYNFKSTNGSSTISELKFSATSGTVTSVKVGNVSVQPVSGVAYLTGLNLQVPIGGTGLYQPVYVSYAPVGATGLTSGTNSTLTLTDIKSSSGGTTQVQTGLTVAAPTVRLVGSKPAVTVTSANNAGLTLGENHLMDVTVAADAQGAIQQNVIVFTVSTSGVTASTLASTRLADGNNTIAGYVCVVSGATPTFTVTCTNAGGYVISGSKTFSLYGTVGGTLGAAGASSVSTQLAAPATFSWTDIAGSAGSAETTNNTTYLYNYPTQTNSIHN